MELNIHGCDIFFQTRKNRKSKMCVMAQFRATTYLCRVTHFLY